MDKLTLQHLPVEGEKVLMRVDFNTPLTKEGKIADLSRIQAALPSINYVLKNGGALVLMSHMGRPKGKRDEKSSLKVCAQALENLLNQPVQFASDCIGDAVKNQADQLKPGQVLLLENLRFHAAEEHPDSDPSFAKRLSELGTCYVNDAFGTTHRNHSSIGPITAFFPGKAAAGLLLQKEIETLDTILHDSSPPFYLLIGGAKISSKIGVLSHLAPKTQGVFIGGAMAFTFLKAQGYQIGDSLCEADQLEMAAQFLEDCAEKKLPIFLPEDLTIANALTENAEISTVTVEKGIPNGWQGVDIGPKTRMAWTEAMSNAHTIFWNGPMGVFEIPRFATGTYAIAQAIGKLKNAFTVVGGGDSLSAISHMHLESNFSHLSTGGGACLEYLEFGHLPGIDALSAS